jgi:hypothetical protein
MLKTLWLSCVLLATIVSLAGWFTSAHLGHSEPSVPSPIPSLPPLPSTYDDSKFGYAIHINLPPGWVVLTGSSSQRGDATFFAPALITLERVGQTSEGSVHVQYWEVSSTITLDDFATNRWLPARFGAPTPLSYKLTTINGYAAVERHFLFPADPMSGYPHDVSQREAWLRFPSATGGKQHFLGFILPYPASSTSPTIAALDSASDFLATHTLMRPDTEAAHATPP